MGRRLSQGSRFSCHDEAVTTKNDERVAFDKELVEAAFICDLVRVRQALARGADVNARDDDERTPLFSAVLGGSVALAGLLLESGADVNARDNQGFTALHYAAQEQLAPFARLLLAKGADVNLRDQDGATPLWRAVFSGPSEVVLVLLKAGAKPDLANHEGVTPRELAERLGVSLTLPS